MENKMPRGETRMTLSAGVALAAIFGACPAFAQSDESGARDAARGADGGSLLAEIVVTAQRREENVQSVPIAITALGGRQLAELNIQDAQRIVDFVPNFKAGGLGGPGGPPFFNIRGISFVDFSNINEGSVALYVDDIYQTAQGAGSAQLFDLERVEVLRGPQGTLFGRNTTAGLVHYVTRKPTDDFIGDLSLQYGSYDQMILQMAAGGAVTEGLRARFALKYNRDDGWQKDPRNGNRYAVTNAIAARFIGQADLGPSATIEAKIEYSHNAGQTAVPRPLFLLDPANPSGYCGGRPVPGTAADRAHAACILSSQGVSRTAGKALAGFKATQAISDAGDLPFNYTSWGGYVKASADLGFGELVAISGFQKFRQYMALEADGYDNQPYGAGSGDLATHFWSNSRTFSQEMRLSSDTEGGLKWQAGAFYYTARQTAPFSITIDNVLIDLISYTTHTRSLAGFGQVDIPLLDALSVSAGARYTEDKRRFDPLDCSQSRTGTVCNPTLIDRIAEGRWTYRLGVDFKPMDDVMLYASYSRGFKSGGWNTARVANLRGPVGSEQIDNFELGFKGSLANGSVSLNAALFHYKYKGMQALIGANDPISGTTQTLYINAGDPRAYGAEAELSARPIDNLELRIGAGWLDTKVRADPNFTADGRSLNGNRLQQAPTFSGNLVIRYTIPLGTGGGISLQADGRYQTKVFVGIDNDPSEMIAAYAVANVRVGWKSDGGQYSIEAFADNVFDKNYYQHIYHQTLASFPATVTGSSPLFDSSYAVWGRPRTWGIRAGYSF